MYSAAATVVVASQRRGGGAYAAATTVVHRASGDSNSADTDTNGHSRSARATIVHVLSPELKLCTKHNQLQITDSTSCITLG